MTDRQLYDLYFHPRDEDGSIKARHEVETPMSEEEEKNLFFWFGKATGIPEDDLKREWERKRGDRSKNGQG